MKEKCVLAAAAAMLLAMPGAMAQDAALYEAEAAMLHGNVAVSQDAAASGGKVIGRFEGDADTADFSVSIGRDGTYDLTFVCKGIGGGKTNRVKIDGRMQGEFTCAGTEFERCTLRGVMLDAGEHTVTVCKSWGWIWLDCLMVTPAEPIADSAFDIAPVLADAGATPQAQALYAYLCESYGHVTLAGQHCDGGYDGPECSAIYSVTGKYPAIVGLDMMDYSPQRQALGAKSTAVEAALGVHERGGIVTFCWHWNAPTDTLIEPIDRDTGSPSWWGGFYTRNTNFDIAAVMDGRDPEGKAAIDADIAAIAKQLGRLQDAGVPVLWRPLHEASGGWFWWGAKGPQACKALWIYLYEQLTQRYEIHNLIWVWNGQDAAWYPGDAYVDIIGEDIYADKRDYGANNAKFAEILDNSGGAKLIALTENGVVPDIEQMVKTRARWLWFNTWSGGFVQKDGRYSEEYTESSLLKRVYDSEYVITLDELPERW